MSRAVIKSPLSVRKLGIYMHLMQPCETTKQLTVSLCSRALGSHRSEICKIDRRAFDWCSTLFVHQGMASIGLVMVDRRRHHFSSFQLKSGTKLQLATERAIMPLHAPRETFSSISDCSRYTCQTDLSLEISGRTEPHRQARDTFATARTTKDGTKEIH